MKWLKSKTIWSILVLVALNTIPEVKALLPENLQPIADILLGLLAVYGRVKPKVA